VRSRAAAFRAIKIKKNQSKSDPGQVSGKKGKRVKEWIREKGKAR